MSGEGKASAEFDKERADSEGMSTAIGSNTAKTEEVQELLAKPEFLQDVIDYFRGDEDLLTVEEATQALFDELEGLDEYQEALEAHGGEKLRSLMKEFLGAEEWAQVKQEESDRAVRMDKTRGGTPG